MPLTSEQLDEIASLAAKGARGVEVAAIVVCECHAPVMVDEIKWLRSKLAEAERERQIRAEGGQGE